MGDAARRPLEIPPSQIPYLEKHRILELFHEIGRELVIQKPKDHVVFIKQILLNAVANRDNAKVIMLCSPKINCLEIAVSVVDVTKQIIITRESLTNYIMGKHRIATNVTPELNAKYISRFLSQENANKFGWIMLGCIRDKKDAECLLQSGILPTHVIHLIPPFLPNLNELLYCNISSGWPEYRRNILGIRSAFSQTIVLEVHLNQKSLQEITAECVDLIKTRPRQVKIKPRIVLIGPRGCGRKTQAKLLTKALGVIHIDFEYLICQAWMSESELGEKLRTCKSDVCLHSELLAQVVNKRILETECLTKGWVLSAFPYSDYDMKYLDCLDTPPNRVIFMECDLNVCKERLEHRRINVYTGSTTNIKENSDFEKKQLATHPKDHVELINAELSYYCQNYDNLRKYCGETAIIVNADQSERWVHECIVATVYRDAPRCLPREPLPADSISAVSSCCLSPVPSDIMNYVTINNIT